MLASDTGLGQTRRGVDRNAPPSTLPSLRLDCRENRAASKLDTAVLHGRGGGKFYQN
ncbi:MAG: hypothetical protein H0U54_14580 [Acidobacteria bacterium]|nr:hypothetical protein [Acidobacteriota bacterium]